MRRIYWVRFVSSEHPTHEPPEEDGYEAVPGNGLATKLTVELARAGFSCDRVDCTNYSWFTWCKVRNRRVHLELGPDPDDAEGIGWLLFCASASNFLARLIFGDDDDDVFALANAVDALLHADSTFTEVRWCPRYPDPDEASTPHPTRHRGLPKAKVVRGPRR